MECLEKPVWDRGTGEESEKDSAEPPDGLQKPAWEKYTREELERIRIEAPDEEMWRKVLQNWDSIAKPLEAWGALSP